jgi:micrococcal nuclease
MAGCSDGGSSPSPPTEGAFVERVVDGDTLVVTVDGQEDRVRLIGVDTPETKHPSKPVECFGKEASAFTESLLPEGTEVRLERDVEARDRYDRLLAYVYRVDDGLFVNRELLAQGYAAVLTVPPNVAHTDEFVALAGEARREGRGLWSACGDVGVPAA